MEEATVHSNWQKLDMFVLEFKDKPNRHPAFFEAMDKKPFTRESIDKIISEGICVRAIDMFLNGALVTDEGKKIIAIRQDLEGYERDKTLFHELIHACYGDYTFDNSLHDDTIYIASSIMEYLLKDKALSQENIYFIENALITEWYARQLRTQPTLLRYAIQSFGLEEYIYDRASAQAFHPAFNDPRQSLFSFGKEHYEDVRNKYLKLPAFMD